MEDLELLKQLCVAYKNYIDTPVFTSEQERSDMLMIARELEIEANVRGLL